MHGYPNVMTSHDRIDASLDPMASALHAFPFLALFERGSILIEDTAGYCWLLVEIGSSLARAIFFLAHHAVSGQCAATVQSSKPYLS